MRSVQERNRDVNGVRLDRAVEVPWACGVVMAKKKGDNSCFVVFSAT